MIELLILLPLLLVRGRCCRRCRLSRISLSSLLLLLCALNMLRFCRQQRSVGGATIGRDVAKRVERKCRCGIQEPLVVEVVARPAR